MFSFIGNLYKQYGNYFIIAVFAMLITVFYGSTFQNGFVLDDVGAIQKTPYLKSFEYLPKVVTGCLWEHANQGCMGRTLYYRPVQSFLFLLTHQVSWSPWAFHAVTVLLFFGLVSLFFHVLKVLTKNT